MNIFETFSIKKFGLGLAIIIIFNLFVNYGINAFYKEPDYNKFCNPERLKQAVNTRQSCEVVGGLWTDNVGYLSKDQVMNEYQTQSGAAPTVIQINNQQPTGYCDQDYTCRKDFESVDNIYRRNVFIVWIIAGIVAIGASFSITAVSMLSTSFMFGGLLSLLIGTLEYWSAMQDYLRFIILGIALAFLVVVAYRKLK